MRARSGTGLLGASTPTALDGFEAGEVAVAGGAIYAIGGNTLVILRPAADVPGTFTFPHVIRLNGVLSARIVSVAVGDVDLDGRTDVAVGVQGSSGGVPVFRVAFLKGALIVGTPPGGRLAAPLFPAAGRPLSLAITRLNGDGFGDIAYVEKGAYGSVRLLISAAGSFAVPGVQVLTVPLDAPIVAVTPGLAPQLIASGVLNVSGDGQGPPDATPNMAVATSEGTLVLATAPSAPPLVVRDILATGRTPVGVIAADVTGDARVDLLTALVPHTAAVVGVSDGQEGPDRGPGGRGR